jgi:hypothetical protein
MVAPSSVGAYARVGAYASFKKLASGYVKMLSRSRSSAPLLLNYKKNFPRFHLRLKVWKFFEALFVQIKNGKMMSKMLSE